MQEWLREREGGRENEGGKRCREERREMSDEEREGEKKRERWGEVYANDKVWLAVGGISSSGGNMCVGTNCRQEFIRLVVR